MANPRTVEGCPSVRPNGHDWKRADAILRRDNAFVPLDWSSFPPDARPDSPSVHEIEHALDTVRPSQPEIPAHDQSALDLTSVFIDRRVHRSPIVVFRLDHGTIARPTKDKDPETRARRQRLLDAEASAIDAFNDAFGDDYAGGEDSDDAAPAFHGLNERTVLIVEDGVKITAEDVRPEADLDEVYRLIKEQAADQAGQIVFQDGQSLEAEEYLPR